jgi:hypothetical protein
MKKKTKQMVSKLQRHKENEDGGADRCRVAEADWDELDLGRKHLVVCYLALLRMSTRRVPQTVLSGI